MTDKTIEQIDKELREDCIDLYYIHLSCIGCDTVTEAINKGMADCYGGIYMNDGMFIYPNGKIEMN